MVPINLNGVGRRRPGGSMTGPRVHVANADEVVRNMRLEHWEIMRSTNDKSGDNMTIIRRSVPVRSAVVCSALCFPE